MNLNFRNYDETKYVPKFQEGGPMPEEAPVEEAPVEEAPAQGGDPMQQLLEVAAQALQAQDCQAAMAVCQALIQLAQGGAPQEVPEEAPVYKMGGKLSRRIKK